MKYSLLEVMARLPPSGQTNLIPAAPGEFLRLLNLLIHFLAVLLFGAKPTFLLFLL